ncbi:hypothetical protein [Rubrivirga sp. IMCC43871]|uniref:hypothetical protein n=1 Tax=Rubrivirga sp. IMCC43871 TaxID=3391575 RepID=UPI00398F91A5
MILRRITQHVKDQNRTAIGIDFVIVVVGVFVGLQVSNWSAERADAREAAAYRQRLAADVRAEREAIDARVAYYRDVRAHGGAALAVLDGAAGRRVPRRRVPGDAGVAVQPGPADV